jgi:hypothetical protein
MFLQNPERRLRKMAGDCTHRGLVTTTTYYPFIQPVDVTL